MITQIYEIQNPVEAQEMISLGIDHIGSVIEPTNIDNNEILETIQLVQKSGAKSSLIPLVNDDVTICKIIDFYQPDIIHLCDTINSQSSQINHIIDIQCELKNRYPEIMFQRSIPIPPAGKGDLQEVLKLAALFCESSDFYLTDTLIVNDNTLTPSEQPVQGFVGITGKTCDWDIAHKLVKHTSIPVILAGGISPKNVSQGIVKVKPYGVDSCTCTNAVDKTGKPIRFKKDLPKVKAFIQTVQATKLA